MRHPLAASAALAGGMIVLVATAVLLAPAACGCIPTPTLEARIEGPFLIVEDAEHLRVGDLRVERAGEAVPFEVRREGEVAPPASDLAAHDIVVLREGGWNATRLVNALTGMEVR